MAKKKKDNTPITLDEMLARLTLDEKISLLSGYDGWTTPAIKRAGVPAVRVADGPHGLRYQDEITAKQDDSRPAVCFPSGASLAATFDRELLTKLGRALGEWCNYEGIDVILGPAINIKRSPLCGRNFEYLSEDPYVIGELTTAYINAVQSTGTGVSMKHFACNNQEYHRRRTSAEIDERALREIYLKGFETAVKKAKPYTIMCSYNRLNGVQNAENKWLLTDVLRNEWGYNGIVMSDWGAVTDRPGGVLAGLDLEMPSSQGKGAKEIKEALESGRITEADVDVCARRMLNFIFKCSQKTQKFKPSLDEQHELAKEIACNSIILLKNDNNLLPLKKEQKVAFIGEFAQTPRYQGGGSSHVHPYKTVSILDCVRDCPNIKYAKGFKILSEKGDAALENEAVELASNSDVVVVFAGLPEYIESEGYDRKSMTLPEKQNSLIERLAKVNSNIVVVLHNGAPVEIPWADKVSAIIGSNLAGEAIGEAQLDILYGNVNPSGRLAETYPIKYTDAPCSGYFPGNQNTSEYRESIYVGYRYYETFGKDVLFPFGHGLSYTSFSYTDLNVDNKTIYHGKGATVSCVVTNTGKRDGREVVQLYIAPRNSAVYRPALELKGFESVYLKSGESKTVTFHLDEDSFSYYNVKEKAFVCENGKVDIKIGASSKDIRLRDTLSLTGFKNYDLPYDEEINSLYKTGDVSSIRHADFERLCGRRIDLIEANEPFTWEACLTDMIHTKNGRWMINNPWFLRLVTGNTLSDQFLMGEAIWAWIGGSGGIFSETSARALYKTANGQSKIKTIAIMSFEAIKNRKKCSTDTPKGQFDDD